MTKVTEIVNNWSIEPGNVLWNDLKEQLMELPNDILVDIIDMWIKNYWTNQNYWIVHVERDFGQEEAIRLDSEVWQNTARAQASRLKKVLQLGNDLRDLAITLRFTAAQWVTAGFDWQIDEISMERLVFKVSKCPMGTYRTEQGLPLFPCRYISPPLYESIAKAINDDIIVNCIHAHPDEPKEGILCKWEFILKKKS